jgi:hypothetical protein
MLVVTPSRNWVQQVRRFVRPPAAARCELCGTELPEDHTHLVEIDARRLVCACRRCVVPAAAESRFRRLPSTVRRLADVALSDAEWESLQIPIGLAFIFHSTPQNRPVALYPGPAGATESLLGLEAWSALVERNPALAVLEPDVEALLIDRTEGRRDYYKVPIDRCYALAGLMRRHWRGLSGGSEAWAAIGQFFAKLRQAAGGDWAHG